MAAISSSDRAAPLENEEPESERLEIADLSVEHRVELLGQLINMCKEVDGQLCRALLKCKQARKVYLGTRTTGSVVGVVGAVISTLGVALIIPTVGGSLGLTFAGIGTSLASGTLIASSVMTDAWYARKWIRKVVDIVEGWQKLDNEYRRIKVRLREEAGKSETGTETSDEFQSGSGRLTKGEKISNWLAMRKFSDKKICVRDLKVGDHIFRRGTRSGAAKDVSMISAYYHHGVYLTDNKVCDFVGGNYPRVVSLEEFLDGAPELFFRNYHGRDVHPKLTLALADQSLEVRRTYNLFTCNCEHFATELKLRKSWSQQAAAAKMAKYNVQTVLKPTTKLGPALAEALSTAVYAGSLKEVSEIVSNGHFVWRGVLGWQELSLTTVSLSAEGVNSVLAAMPVFSGVLGAAFTAIDLVLLARDWVKKPPSIEAIKAYLIRLVVKRLEYEADLRQLMEENVEPNTPLVDL